MAKEELEAQLKKTVDEYILQSLKELADKASSDEPLSISSASQALVNNRLTNLASTVEQVLDEIRRRLQGDTGVHNYYWEDGLFFTNKNHASVPNNAVAITDQLWTDWCAQKNHPEDDDITQQMDGQVLIKKQRFTSTDGRRMMCVTHLLTTETPNRMKLFYFMQA